MFLQPIALRSLLRPYASKRPPCPLRPFAFARRRSSRVHGKDGAEGKVESDVFCAAMADLFLGEDPVSPTLKAAIK